MYRNLLRTVYMNGDPDAGGGGTPPTDPGTGGEPPTDPGTPPTDPGTPPTDPGTGGEPPTKFFDTVPDDWREQLAGDDQKRLNQLNRIPDFNTFANSYFEAQQMIRSGQIEPLQAPGENATDEEIATYREAMGIPEKVEDYSVALDEGLVLGDEDQAIMPAIYEAAHQANIPPSAVSVLANAMLKGREGEFHKTAGEQKRHADEATVTLREAWQGDYDTNINLIRNTIIGALPEEMQEEFEHAMMPNGRKIFNSPEIMTLLADAARKINPAATVVPGGANPMQTIETEIAQLEARMGSPEWFKDTAAQKRYQDLVAARENLQ